jgi:hypothetical protein
MKQGNSSEFLLGYKYITHLIFLTALDMRVRNEF